MAYYIQSFQYTMTFSSFRGLLARAMIQAQAASPTFTHVYAALSAIINSKVWFSELTLKNMCIFLLKLPLPLLKCHLYIKFVTHVENATFVLATSD